MLQRFRKLLWLGVVSLMTLGAVANAARAQTPPDDELRGRIERLEKQNQELMNALKAVTPAPGAVLGAPAAAPGGAPAVSKDDVQKIVGDYLKARDQTKAEADALAKAEAEAKGHTVGKDLVFRPMWKDGLWFETQDKAFKFHVGGRTQLDAVGVNANDSVQFGKGGIGVFDDAVNIRRGRFTFEGSLYENFNFCMEWDFVNTTDVDPTNAALRSDVVNTPVPTDLWVEIAKLPIIGNVRVGNQKPPIGFEHYTSSRFLNFMERSLSFDAFIEEGNNGFSPGIKIYNWSEDERMTWAIGGFKTTRSIFGWNVGDGELNVTGRVTWLPYWQEDGRYLVHLGLGGRYGDLDEHAARFRARTELRNGPAALHNIVAITRINEGSSQSLFNPEFVFQYGPFLLQAEYQSTLVTGVTNYNTPTATNVVNKGSSSYYAQGAYVEALYFLTGENRDYNKKDAGFGRVRPYKNFWWVPGQNCGNLFSSGAWQVGARYSWLDLNDGLINGGQVHDLTLGVNWFLNPNFKIQSNYELGYREIPGGTSSGTFQGVGVRFAVDW